MQLPNITIYKWTKKITKRDIPSRPDIFSLLGNKSFFCKNLLLLLHIYHSQLLKKMILKFNSSSIALLIMPISKCYHNRVLYWVYTDPYCIIYWAIQENIAPAATPIRRIKSSNIALPGRKIQKLKLLEIENVCIMTQVRTYSDIWPQHQMLVIDNCYAPRYGEFECLKWTRGWASGKSLHVGPIL